MGLYWFEYKLVSQISHGQYLYIVLRQGLKIIFEGGNFVMIVVQLIIALYA